MKTSLICGVSGQDGAYLSDLLLNRGYRVYGTSRDAQISSFANLVRLGIREQVEVVSMALTDFRSVLQTISSIEPDEIYNLAGQSSVGLSFQQPVETMESITIGTLNLLEAIRFLGRPVRLYNAGSSECFGETGDNAANADTPFRPKSPYAVAKSAAHWEVSNYRDAYGLFACTGILFNHESPLRPERFVTKKIISTACRISDGSDERLNLGNIQIRRDWGWAPEYVEAMWFMLQQDEPHDFVIATGESNSLQCFLETAFLHYNLDWKKYVSLDDSLIRPAEIMDSGANPEEALMKLGWKAQYRMKDVVKMMCQGMETPLLNVSKANS